MAGISPSASLLNSFDPTNPSSIDSSLTGAGLADSYYQQGVNGTGSYDPGVQATATVPPSAVPVSASATPASVASSGPNQYQQALSSLQVWSDQTLITSALGNSSDASSAGDDSSLLAQELEAEATSQAQGQANQQQAALAAAQSALSAGTNVDTTA
jgi:hypothetical protein